MTTERAQQLVDVIRDISSDQGANKTATRDEQAALLLNILQSNLAPFDLYIVKLNQSGTDEPEAVEIYSDLPADTIEYGYAQEGAYVVQLVSGSFDMSKVSFSITQPNDTGNYPLTNISESGNVILIETSVGGVATDDILVDARLEIKILR